MLYFSCKSTMDLVLRAKGYNAEQLVQLYDFSELQA